MRRKTDMTPDGERAKTSAEGLMAHVAPQLTAYKRPSEVILMDALPATSTGKLLKHKLAESLQGKPVS
jgi:long-chain acyl-CoA synthetase